MIGRLISYLTILKERRWTGWFKIHLSKGIIDKFKEEINIELP